LFVGSSSKTTAGRRRNSAARATSTVSPPDSWATVLSSPAVPAMPRRSSQEGAFLDIPVVTNLSERFR
jgi:hypothetical protein